ncbi:MAG: hypothetical protein OEZ01_10475 [Candidatus Heimdallarchaeota archaeon]|nr:hypothetical protein [Candidatus Heimdallarchaeota archaeon]MDH5646425.1 hypothetical protein [Candidatus Heimdallarchaeota archaeon]
MKKFAIIPLLVLMGLFITSTPISTNAQTTTLDDQCDNPSEEITITANVGNTFDKQELVAPRGACITIKFTNLDTSIAHDFTIDEIEGEIGRVYIYVANSTAGDDGTGISTQNVQLPDDDTEFDYYCSVTGHSSTMFGKLIVGEGAPAPSTFVFFGFLVTIVLVNKKFRK